jgi:hypothetical protein
MHGKSLTPKNATEKAMGALNGFGDEVHREQTRDRVIEAHTKLHAEGKVVGGRVFGYRNQDVFSGVDTHGRPLRSHVEHVIDPVEAAVVRRIFTLYDSGLGLKRIAKMLTSEGAAHPKPFVFKDGSRPFMGWAPSTVRAVLTREVYHGVRCWNKTKKKDSWGKWAPSDRPESEWLRVPVEHLRLIDEPLWNRVAARRAETEGKAVRFSGGLLSGRPPKNKTANLLAGLATCALCGGGLIVETSARKRGRVPEYICSRRRLNGSCANALRIAVADMNEPVLAALEEHALTPAAIESVIQLSERADVATRKATLTKEAADVTRRIGRLVAAIETGGDAVSLVAKLHALEKLHRAIQDEMESLHPIPRLAPSVIEDRLTEWRRLLRGSHTQARTVIQRIIRGRLVFTPRADGAGYDFTADTRFDRLFAGIASPRPSWMPHGPSGVENPHDEDYGRLLDRIYALRVASPRRIARVGALQTFIDDDIAA